MKLPPRWDESNPVGQALNQVCDFFWSIRVLETDQISNTGDGLLIDGGSGGAGSGRYPFQAIAVPLLPGEPPASPFAIAVDRGHVVNLDGIPFAPSNLRGEIELPPYTEDIIVYLDLTLEPETGQILSGTVAQTDGILPAQPAGTVGTNLGPAKAYKQLFTITTTADGVDMGSVAEHSKSNFALLRYPREGGCDFTIWAMAFIAA